MNHTKKGIMTYDTILSMLIVIVMLYVVVYTYSVKKNEVDVYKSKESTLIKLTEIADFLVKHSCVDAKGICRTNEIDEGKLSVLSNEISSRFGMKDVYVGFDYPNVNGGSIHLTCLSRVVLRQNDPNPALLYVCGNYEVH